MEVADVDGELRWVGDAERGAAGQERVGELLWRGKRVSTPALAVHTSGGAVPMLGPGVLERTLAAGPVPAVLALQLSDVLEACIDRKNKCKRRRREQKDEQEEAANAEAVEMAPVNLSQVLCLPRDPPPLVMLFPHPPHAACATKSCHSGGLACETHAGRRVVSPAEFSALVSRLRTPTPIPITPYDPPPAVGGNCGDGQGAAEKRSTKWAEIVLSRAGVGNVVVKVSNCVCGGDEAAVRGAQKWGGVLFHGPLEGQSPEEHCSSMSRVVPHVPVARPRVAVGYGTPWEVVGWFSAGADVLYPTFPFEAASSGLAVAVDFSLNPPVVAPGGPLLDLSSYAEGELDMTPIVPSCQCCCCERYGRGYIRHLLQGHELSGMELLVAHNLSSYLTLVGSLRRAALDGTLQTLSFSIRRAFGM